MLKKFTKWNHKRKARNAAKKYDLDINHKCVFDEHISNYRWFTHSGKPADGATVEVKMESGKFGLYNAVLIGRCSDNAGQKNWRFEFQGYKDD